MCKVQKLYKAVHIDVSAHLLSCKAMLVTLVAFLAVKLHYFKQTKKRTCLFHRYTCGLVSPFTALSGLAEVSHGTWTKPHFYLSGHSRCFSLECSRLHQPYGNSSAQQLCTTALRVLPAAPLPHTSPDSSLLPQPRYSGGRVENPLWVLSAGAAAELPGKAERRKWQCRLSAAPWPPHGPHSCCQLSHLAGRVTAAPEEKLFVFPPLLSILVRSAGGGWAKPGVSGRRSLVMEGNAEG